MKLHICKLNQQKEFVVPPVDFNATVYTKGYSVILATALWLKFMQAK